MKSKNPIQIDAKETRGGRRLGAGRPKAEYKTTTLSFRVRTEWAEDIKKVVKDKIEELKLKQFLL